MGEIYGIILEGLTLIYKHMCGIPTTQWRGMDLDSNFDNYGIPTP